MKYLQYNPNDFSSEFTAKLKLIQKKYKLDTWNDPESVLSPYCHLVKSNPFVNNQGRIRKFDYTKHKDQYDDIIESVFNNKTNNILTFFVIWPSQFPPTQPTSKNILFKYFKDNNFSNTTVMYEINDLIIIEFSDETEEMAFYLQLPIIEESIRNSL